MNSSARTHTLLIYQEIKMTLEKCRLEIVPQPTRCIGRKGDSLMTRGYLTSCHPQLNMERNGEVRGRGS